MNIAAAVISDLRLNPLKGGSHCGLDPQSSEESPIIQEFEIFQRDGL